MKSITLRGLPHPVSNEIYDLIKELEATEQRLLQKLSDASHEHVKARTIKNARIEKLEAALNEIIKRDQKFYDACDYCYDDCDYCYDDCDYCYDEAEQGRADGKSLAYAQCREIAGEGLKP
jgi:hypothetical protein